MRLSRRALMLGAGAVGFATALPSRRSYAEPATKDYRIAAKSATANLTGDGYPDTAVWAYEGIVPGPELRVRQGQPVRITVVNKLDEDTTVHWHGIRLPNAMDGVPGLTQKPIRPGESFVYEFTPPDAGTFWYHPHVDSAAQVGFGLYGPLIVTDPDEPAGLGDELVRCHTEDTLDQPGEADRRKPRMPRQRSRRDGVRAMRFQIFQRCRQAFRDGFTVAGRAEIA